MNSTSMLNFYFEGKTCWFDSKKDMYWLDASRLSDEKIYLIFQESLAENFCVIDYLRYITFSQAPELVQIQTKTFKEIPFCAVSIPKEYKETCEKIAKFYSLNCKHISQAAFCGENGIVIPSSEKILVIRGSYSETEHQKEVKYLKYLGKKLDASQLD